MQGGQSAICVLDNRLHAHALSNGSPVGPTMEETAPPSPAVLPVSLLVGSARRLIERHLGLAWISGEVSNFTRAASGHCYFVLKDDQAQVRCVMYRQKAQLIALVLQDGAQVEVRATPTI